MSSNPILPGAMPASAFDALCADVGSWIWGAVRGAFNEKASLSQIVVDPVIGMVPVVGDVTAVRDLIAVTIGLVDEPKKRDDTWQWVLLVVLLFALIPVLGGVTTHSLFVRKSSPIDTGIKFWGVGTPPKTAKEWRESAAVLDEWNRDGYMVVGS